jgi:hypothetical protein
VFFSFLRKGFQFKRLFFGSFQNLNAMSMQGEQWASQRVTMIVADIYPTDSGVEVLCRRWKTSFNFRSVGRKK